jgi:hypothetical protein
LGTKIDKNTQELVGANQGIQAIGMAIIDNKNDIKEVAAYAGENGVAIATNKKDIKATQSAVTDMSGKVADNSARINDIATKGGSLQNSELDADLRGESSDSVARTAPTGTTSVAAVANTLNAKTKANTTSIDANKTAIANNDARIESNTKKIDGVQNESRKGISGVAAISGIKYQPMTTGQGQIGVGYGNFKGDSAIALGLGAQVSDNIMVNMAASATAGSDTEAVFSAGATYKFNVFNK